MAIELKVQSDSEKAREDLRRLRESVDGIKSSVERTNSGFKQFATAIVTAVATSASFSRFTTLSDDITQMETRLRLATGSADDFNQALRDTRIIASNTRQSLASVTSLYQRISQSTKTLGVNQNQVGQATQNVAMLMALSAANTIEASAAITQLGQALASGRLQGDELRSLSEAAPALTQSIADALGVTIGGLRQLGEAGKLTSDKVFGALLKRTKEINQEFTKVSVTYGQAFQNIGNSSFNLMSAFLRLNTSKGGLPDFFNNIAASLSKFADDLPDIILDAELTIYGFIDDVINTFVGMPEFIRKAFYNVSDLLAKTFDNPVIKKGLDESLFVIKGWANTAEKSFAWLYDKVIGHSWIPDLVDGVAQWTSRLNKDPISNIDSFATGASKIIGSIWTTVKSAVAKSSQTIKGFWENTDTIFKGSAILSAAAGALIAIQSGLAAKIATTVLAGLSAGLLFVMSPFKRQLISGMGNIFSTALKVSLLASLGIGGASLISTYSKSLRERVKSGEKEVGTVGKVLVGIGDVIETGLDQLSRVILAVKDVFDLSSFGKAVKQFFGIKDSTISEQNAKGENPNVRYGPSRFKEDRPLFHDALNSLPISMQMPTIAGIAAIASLVVSKFISAGALRTSALGLVVAGAEIASNSVDKGDSKETKSFVATALNTLIDGFRFALKSIMGDKGTFGEKDPIGLLSFIAKLALLFAAGRKFLGGIAVKGILAPFNLTSSLTRNVEGTFTKRSASRSDAEVRANTMSIAANTKELAGVQKLYDNSVKELARSRNMAGQVTGMIRAQEIAAGRRSPVGLISGIPGRSIGDIYSDARTTRVGVQSREFGLADLNRAAWRLSKENAKIADKNNSIQKQIQESREAFNSGVKNTFSGIGGIFGSLGFFNLGTKWAEQMTNLTEWQKVGVAMGSALVGQFIGAAVGNVVAAVALKALAIVGAVIMSPILLGIAGVSALVASIVYLFDNPKFVTQLIAWGTEFADSIKNWVYNDLEPQLKAWSSALFVWIETGLKPQIDRLWDWSKNLAEDIGKSILTALGLNFTKQKPAEAQVAVQDKTNQAIDKANKDPNNKNAVVDAQQAIANSVRDKFFGASIEDVWQRGILNMLSLVSEGFRKDLEAYWKRADLPVKSLKPVEGGGVPDVSKDLTDPNIPRGFIFRMLEKVANSVVSVPVPSKAVDVEVLKNLTGAIETNVKVTEALSSATWNLTGKLGEPVNTSVFKEPIKKATGGFIRGAGTGTSDSIPALLSNGEFVVKASATRNNRGLLESINNGLPGFKDGGYVDLNGDSYIDSLQPDKRKRFIALLDNQISTFLSIPGLSSYYLPYEKGGLFDSGESSVGIHNISQSPNKDGSYIINLHEIGHLDDALKFGWKPKEGWLKGVPDHWKVGGPELKREVYATQFALQNSIFGSTNTKKQAAYIVQKYLSEAPMSDVLGLDSNWKQTTYSIASLYGLDKDNPNYNSAFKDFDGKEQTAKLRYLALENERIVSAINTTKAAENKVRIPDTKPSERASTAIVEAIKEIENTKVVTGINHGDLNVPKIDNTSKEYSSKVLNDKISKLSQVPTVKELEVEDFNGSFSDYTKKRKRELEYWKDPIAVTKEKNPFLFENKKEKGLFDRINVGSIMKDIGNIKVDAEGVFNSVKEWFNKLVDKASVQVNKKSNRELNNLRTGKSEYGSKDSYLVGLGDEGSQSDAIRKMMSHVSGESSSLDTVLSDPGIHAGYFDSLFGKISYPDISTNKFDDKSLKQAERNYFIALHELGHYKEFLDFGIPITNNPLDNMKSVIRNISKTVRSPLYHDDKTDNETIATTWALENSKFESKLGKQALAAGLLTYDSMSLTNKNQKSFIRANTESLIDQQKPGMSYKDLITKSKFNDYKFTDEEMNEKFLSKVSSDKIKFASSVLDQMESGLGPDAFKFAALADIADAENYLKMAPAPAYNKMKDSLPNDFGKVSNLFERIASWSKDKIDISVLPDKLEKILTVFGYNKFASGGHIRGAGHGTSDEIPAMLSNGEFVVNAKATKENRALLESINSGKAMSYFSKGGSSTKEKFDISRYSELIKKEIAKNGNLFGYSFVEAMIKQESFGRDNAISPVGAAGVMQFMPDTGKDYGLQTLEDRLNPLKSIPAGIKYLSDIVKRSGARTSDELLAGYHSGEGSLRAFRKKGYFSPEGVADTTKLSKDGFPNIASHIIAVSKNMRQLGIESRQLNDSLALASNAFDSTKVNKSLLTTTEGTVTLSEGMEKAKEKMATVAQALFDMMGVKVNIKDFMKDDASFIEKIKKVLGIGVEVKKEPKASALSDKVFESNSPSETLSIIRSAFYDVGKDISTKNAIGLSKDKDKLNEISASIGVINDVKKGLAKIKDLNSLRGQFSNSPEDFTAITEELSQFTEEFTKKYGGSENISALLDKQSEKLDSVLKSGLGKSFEQKMSEVKDPLEVTTIINEVISETIKGVKPLTVGMVTDMDDEAKSIIINSLSELDNWTKRKSVGLMSQSTYDHLIDGLTKRINQAVKQAQINAERVKSGRTALDPAAVAAGNEFGTDMSNLAISSFANALKGRKVPGGILGAAVDAFTEKIVDSFAKSLMESLFTGLGLDDFFKNIMSEIYQLGKDISKAIIGNVDIPDVGKVTRIEPFSFKDASAKNADIGTIGTSGEKVPGILDGPVLTPGMGDILNRKTTTNEADVPLSSMFQGIDGTMKKVTEGLDTSLTRGLGSITEVFSGADFSSALNGLKSGLGSLFSGIVSLLGGGGTGFGQFFADGGIVQGASGTAVPIIAHAGEMVLNAAQQKNVANTMSNGAGSTQTINLNITGDISRQTRSEIVKMLPQIASGVNAQNRENNFKR